MMYSVMRLVSDNDMTKMFKTVFKQICVDVAQEFSQCVVWLKKTTTYWRWISSHLFTVVVDEW